jgi:hypothetical protein
MIGGVIYAKVVSKKPGAVHYLLMDFIIALTGDAIQTAITTYISNFESPSGRIAASLIAFAVFTLRAVTLFAALSVLLNKIIEDWEE